MIFCSVHSPAYIMISVFFMNKLPYVCLPYFLYQVIFQWASRLLLFPGRITMNTLAVKRGCTGISAVC